MGSGYLGNITEKKNNNKTLRAKFLCYWKQIILESKLLESATGKEYNFPLPANANEMPSPYAASLKTLKKEFRLPPPATAGF